MNMVSKRLRFEILRRDGHRCRYCGRGADEVRLVIDHVLPLALGGKTVPENLVAACADCNSGKTSVPPGAPLVADVEQDALRWTRAMAHACYLKSAEYAVIDEVVRAVDAEWNDWTVRTPGGRKKVVPRPQDWLDTVARLVRLGVDGEALVRLVGVVMRNRQVAPENAWAYYCGCGWRSLEDLQNDARKLIQDDQERGL